MGLTYKDPVKNIATNTNITAYRIPDYLTCCRCNKYKPRSAFSQNQIKKLDERKGAIKVPCINCTSSQVQELFCQGCDRTKGLDQFSYAQRRNPDHAKCFKCIAKHLNVIADQDVVNEAKARRRMLEQEAEDDVIYGLDTITVRSGPTSHAGTTSSWNLMSETNLASSGGTPRGPASQSSASASTSMAPSDNRRFARVKAPKEETVVESSSEDEEVFVQESDSDSGSAISI